jgi:hypothetical protein
MQAFLLDILGATRRLCLAVLDPLRASVIYMPLNLLVKRSVARTWTAPEIINPARMPLPELTLKQP